ncbi:MAG: hypothetical protein ACI4XP_08525 [Acutalibacteraceae bacterium]
MKKSLIRLFSLFIGAVLLLSLGACNSNKKTVRNVTESSPSNSIVGKYSGRMGSTLKINDDGTCKYWDCGNGTAREGTWEIKGDKITFHKCYSSDLFADISDFDGSFVLECKSMMWANERFTKSS